MTERMLQASIIKLCQLLGIWHYHTYDSRRSAPGFPDLMLVGRKAIFRELKVDGKSPTAIQSDIGLRMQRAGLSWDVWRPADLQSGRIQRELEAIR